MVAFCQLTTSVAGKASNADTAFPDLANSKIYSIFYNPSDSFNPYFLTNSSVDGTSISEVAIPSVLGISSNTYVWDRSGCIGLDGNVYINTDVDGTGTNLGISKINPAVPAETGFVVPTLYSGVSGDQFWIVPFQIAGVNYLAVGEDFPGATTPNFEIINADTMTSVTTSSYPSAGDGPIYMVAGPTTATSCKLYLFVWVDYGDNPVLASATYDTMGGLSFNTIKTYVPSDFDATWLNFYSAANLSYDQVDGNLIIHIQGYNNDFGRANYQVTKLSATTGSPLWAVATAASTGDSYLTTNTVMNKLTSGTYVYTDELSRFYEIDTSDGSQLGGTYHNQHFSLSVAAWIWDSAERVMVFLDPGHLLDDPGWSVWRPDEAPSQRWLLVDGGGNPLDQGVPAYRDPADWNYIYQFRVTHADLGDLSTSGWEIIKRNTTTGVIADRSVVWEFADAGNPFRTVLNGAGTITNLAGASGGSIFGLLLIDFPAPGVHRSAAFIIDRATLAVTSSSTAYTLPASNIGVPGGGQTFLSPDSAFLVTVGYVKSADGTGYIDIRETANLAHHSFIDLTTIGIALGNLQYGAGAFDSDGFLWIATQTVLSGSLNPALAQSTLWKLQITGGASPSLSVVASFTIPDNFHPFTGSFADTLDLNAITYNPSTDCLVIWYNYTFSLNGYITCIVFDISGTSFQTPLEINEGANGEFYSNSDKINWNAVGKFVDYGPTDVSPSTPVLSLIDTNNNPPTKVGTNMVDQWAPPWNLVGSQSALAIGGYYTEGADYFLFTGANTIFYDESYGYLDILLLPVITETITSCCEDPVVVNEAVVTLLSQKALRVAHLVKFDFLSTGSPTFLWNGSYDLSVGGEVWQGLRKLGGIEGLEDTSDLTATQMKFTLSGVSADTLAIAIGEDRSEYVNRLVTVYLQFFDSEWQPVGDPIARASGFMDGIEITRARDQSGNSQRVLTQTAENIFAGRSVPPAGNYTERDQQYRFPGDRGLEFISDTQNTVIPVPW